MKGLIFSCLLIVSSYSFANEYNGCGGARGSQCQEFYSRLEAFKILEAHENGIDDAKGNLTLITQIQKSSKLNLQYLVDNFVYIQENVGGADKTAETRVVFNNLISNLDKAQSLDELSVNFIKVLRNENSLEDGTADFNLIMSNTISGRGSDLVNYFLKILSLEGGAQKTAEAQDTFKRMLSNQKSYSLDDLLKSYETLLRNENERVDAIGNFDLVIQVSNKCGQNLAQTTKDFISVQREVGGAQKTDEARKLFLQLYDM